MSEKLPHAVLFACTQNVIRSPMAAAIMRHLYGHKIYVASIGIKPGEADPFVAAVLAEIGIDIGKHRPHAFADLEDTNFDIAVALSPEAQHWTKELTRTMAMETEYWPTMDPSAAAGSRAQIMDAYREVRDSLIGRIEKRFGPALKSART
jgi:protein-tyrosine-phosphatase